MKPTIRLILLTALRDRLFISVIALELIVLVLALFLGSALIFEVQAAALTFAAAAARLGIVFGLSVFAAFHVERLYGTREIEAILSRTISRGRFMFSYWLALVIAAVLLALPVLAFVVFFQLSLPGVLWWSSTLLLESCIVLAFVLFAAIILERAIPAIFATIGFYLLARLLNFLSGISLHGQQSGVNEIANPLFDAIAMLAPRLDLFAQTRWLVYGPEITEVFYWLPLQAAIYVPLLLLAATIDLRRKEF
jgi:hypothetical protein